MTRNVSLTVLASCVLAGIFGMLEGLLWSGQSPVSFWLGNISSTYLLLAFLAGWAVAARRAPGWVGPVCGLLVTVVALAAFYGWELHNLSLSGAGVRSGFLRYGAGGIVSGPLFGLLGSLWARHRAWYAIGAVGAAFLLEPLAWRVRSGVQLMPADVRHLEFATGLALLALGLIAIARRRNLQQADHQVSTS